MRSALHPARRGTAAAAFAAVVFAACAAPKPVPRPISYVLKGSEPGPVIPLRAARSEISLAVEDSGLQRYAFGINVVPLARGRPHYSLNSTKLMIPASNVKLVTTVAALSILGPKHVFRTEIRMHEGALYVRGDGDPTLRINRLKEIIRKIRAHRRSAEFGGKVYLDASYFKEYSEANDNFRRSGSFNTSLGPLSLDNNAVWFHLHSAGPPLDRVHTYVHRITPDPEGFLVSRSEEPIGFPTHYSPQFEVGWNEARDLHTITVLGLLKPGRHRLAVRKPSKHFGRVFARLARAEGLAVEEVLEGPAPKEAPLLFAYKSQPLHEILRSMNLRSDNFMADQIFLAMGARKGGRTLEDAAKTVERFLIAKVGFRRGRFRLVNGSGLSRRLQLSAAQLTKLLTYARRRKAFGSVFEATLPVAGWSGTLRRRLLDPPALLRVSGKTGMIDYASAVSGFGVGANGAKFAFSIIINDVDGMNATRDWEPLDREAEDEWQKTTDINNRLKAAQDKILDILSRTNL